MQRKGELEMHTEAGRRGDGFPEPIEAANQVARSSGEMRDGEVSVWQ